jgi:twitching motility protein PilT
MARIDKFIEAMKQLGAERLVASAGEKVGLLLPGGEAKPITAQPATVKQLADLVLEIAPLAQAGKVMGGGTIEFPYASPSGAVHVRVSRSGNAFEFEISSEAAATPPAPPPEPAAPSAEPLGTPAPPPRPEPVEGTRPESIEGARPESIEGKPEPPPAIPIATAPAAPAHLDGIDALFHRMVQAGCSDLHLSAGHPPLFRKDGEIVALGQGEAPLSSEVIQDLIAPIVPELSREEFKSDHDTDFSYSVPGLARFRCNLFRDLNGNGGAFRVIPAKIPTAADLGLPQCVLDLCDLGKGLVLVTGPTGSGKSTTLAAMIDHINETRSAHILTIEDPVEFVHPKKRCLINQREVGTHTGSFKRALRAALREDPDIVLVGEMRDLETVSIALETAETGHLVFGTLHTNTAPSTVDRIIDQFPTDRQSQVRTMLSESLRGVIAQTLCRKIGGGRVAAFEILLVNAAISNLIREAKTFQIPSIMQTGKGQGMTTLNDSLLDLVKRKLVDTEEACHKAVARTEFQALLQRQGINVAGATT